MLCLSVVAGGCPRGKLGRGPQARSDALSSGPRGRPLFPLPPRVCGLLLTKLTRSRLRPMTSRNTDTIQQHGQIERMTERRRDRLTDKRTGVNKVNCSPVAYMSALKRPMIGSWCAGLASRSPWLPGRRCRACHVAAGYNEAGGSVERHALYSIRRGCNVA